MAWNGTLFDRSTWQDEKKENVLNDLKKNQSIKRTVIPTFEILYSNDSGFGVYVVEDTEENQFSVRGTFVAPLIIGQTYTVDGYITEYRGEKQIQVNTIHNVKPVNKRGIIAYLQTLKGLKSKAELIYEVFGDESINVLMKDPLQVSKQIRGIGVKSVVLWADQLDKMKDSQAFLSALLGYGLTPNQANALFKKYGEEIVEKIEQNPYFLAKEVRGYGFERCDRIARSMGFDPKSPFRMQEALLHVLDQASNEGHCFLPLNELIARTGSLLTIRMTEPEMNQYLAEQKGVDIVIYRVGEKAYEIPYNELRTAYDNYRWERNKRKKEKLRYVVVSFNEDEIGEAIQAISLERRIVFDDGNIYLRQIFQYQKVVSERVVEIARSKSSFNTELNLTTELDAYLTKQGYELEDKQYEAIVNFSKNKGGFYILNGSAGCGKTFTLKIILAILEYRYSKEKKKCKVKVLAPTGKASKVASKSTERECLTVHRGLGFNPGDGFSYNEENPLDAHVLVVDESTMLDISISKDLMLAIANGTKVIFMGDTKQLPSVGAGNVLKDLIASETVEIVTLDVVKRQGALSGVVLNANRIINGEMIETCEDTKDAYVLHRQTPEGAIKAILASIKRILTFPDYTLEDIQVLAPQRTSSVGTYMLNHSIQQAFNSENNEGKRVLNLRFDVTLDDRRGQETFELYFQKGDKVIHTNNEYDKEWYQRGEFNEYLVDKDVLGITNGECGVIEDILVVKDGNETKTRIIVKYEDKFVFYDNNFQSLDHSWALTIHKSQGSQWKAVIIPIMMQNFMMLDNNLFYTAYTRAEKFSCVVGQPEAIKHAIKTYKTITRYTALSEKLQQVA